MAGIMRRREGQQSENREMARQTQGADPFQWLSSWDPFRSLGAMDPFQRMREMMDPLAQMGGGLSTSGRRFMPDMEVRETKDSYMICADLPGLTENDLTIDVTGNRLTISGKREEEQRDEGDRYWAYERSYGSFTRSFMLPEGTHADQIDARLDNGVLEVRIPKSKGEEAKRISVKGGGAGQTQTQGAASGMPQRSQGASTSGAGTGTSAGATQTGTTGSTEQESYQGGAREKAA